MPFKCLAVFVDATVAGAARVAYAARLASRHGAHLVGLYAVPSLWEGLAAGSFARGQQAVGQAIAGHRMDEADAEEVAKHQFSACCAREGIAHEFRALGRGDADRHTAFNTLHADLVIVGAARSGGLPADWSAEALLLATGVPFLLVPDAWTGPAPEHVVVAWNASREARRAISDALPLLVDAQSVTILVVDPEKNLRHGAEPGADVAHYLSRHGAKVVVERVQSHGAPIAQVILAFAQSRPADLVAVGAYSHGRTTELIFGGVTRSLLRDAAVPLLIAH